MMQTRLVYNHKERHFVSRTGWLRAAVLGANDGIISISSLIIGVASAASDQSDIALAGFAGLIAGAMSMAAGEYVSVCSQSDLETADLEKEKKELELMPDEEMAELVEIYEGRGMSHGLATQVATALTSYDALGTHAREELGITEITTAKPLQAALTSGLAFTAGAVIPILSIYLIPSVYFIIGSSILCLILLGILGALGAITGGSRPMRPALRIMFWGAIAMGLSSIIGHVFGMTV